MNELKESELKMLDTALAYYELRLQSQREACMLPSAKAAYTQELLRVSALKIKIAESLNTFLF